MAMVLILASVLSERLFPVCMLGALYLVLPEGNVISNKAVSRGWPSCRDDVRYHLC